MMKKMFSSGVFIIKSMCLDLLDDDTKYLKKYIWKNEGTTKDQGVYVVPTPKGNSNQRQLDKKAMDWE
jgi:hypothetical protein